MRVAATAIMMAASTKALTRGAFNRLTPTALLGSLLGANGDKYAGAVMGTEDIMKPKAHGIVNGVHFCPPSPVDAGARSCAGSAWVRPAGGRAPWRGDGVRGARHSTASPRRCHRDASHSTAATRAAASVDAPAA